MQAMSKDTPLASSNNGDCFFWYYVIVNARSYHGFALYLISNIALCLLIYSFAYAINH